MARVEAHASPAIAPLRFCAKQHHFSDAPVVVFVVCGADVLGDQNRLGTTPNSNRGWGWKHLCAGWRVLTRGRSGFAGRHFRFHALGCVLW